MTITIASDMLFNALRILEKTLHDCVLYHTPYDLGISGFADQLRP